MINDGSCLPLQEHDMTNKPKSKRQKYRLTIKGNNNIKSISIKK